MVMPILQDLERWVELFVYKALFSWNMFLNVASTTSRFIMNDTDENKLIVPNSASVAMALEMHSISYVSAFPACLV